jgi:cell division septation protein DedD
MKITLSQDEIQEVLENHVNTQLTLASGQSVTVELVSSEDGFIAELDIRSKTTAAPSKPKLATTRTAKPAAVATKPTKVEPEPVEEETATEETPEPVAEEPVTTEAEDVEVAEDPQPEAEPVRKTAGKGSIFNFQNK